MTAEVPSGMSFPLLNPGTKPPFTTAVPLLPARDSSSPSLAARSGSDSTVERVSRVVALTGLSSSAPLVPGRFARLLVPLGHARSLLVPNSAVVQRGQLEIAFVVSKQQALLRLIKTGKHVGNDIEVLAGLDAGETVVIEGAEQLVDGQSGE